MNPARRQFLKGAAAVGIGITLEKLLSGLNTGISLFDKAFAGNGNRNQEKYDKTKKDLYKDLASLTKWCEEKKAYSEQKHLASLIIELYAEDKEKYASAVKALDFDMEHEKDGKSEVRDIPLIDSSARQVFAKAYSKIAKKYSKKFFDLGKKLEKQKTKNTQEALKSIELKEQCMDAALALTPYDKKIRKYLKIEDIKESGDYLESEHFKIKTGKDKKKTTSLLETAEEYYDFFTHEMGRYMKINDLSKKIEISCVTPTEYEKICGNKSFKKMRSFADKESIYLRKPDKNDKEFLKSWLPLRSEEDILREALFTLLCYKRIKQPNSTSSKPVHTDYNDKRVFSLIRGLSVFLSSKPVLSRASSSAYKLLELPETDKTLHTNFLRLYSKKSPILEHPKDDIANPEHDTAMWGRFNYAYFSEGGTDVDDRQYARRLPFILTKWAFSGLIDKFEDYLGKDDADSTANYIKGKKR